jgi:hypothetical protein
VRLTLQRFIARASASGEYLRRLARTARFPWLGQSLPTGGVNDAKQMPERVVRERTRLASGRDGGQPIPVPPVYVVLPRVVAFPLLS